MFYEAFSGTLGVVFAILILVLVPVFSYFGFRYALKAKKEHRNPKWNKKDICSICLRTALSCVILIICSSFMMGMLCANIEHRHCMFHVMGPVFHPSLVLLMVSLIISIFTADW